MAPNGPSTRDTPEDANLLTRALALHRIGRLDQAAALYRAMLAANPRHADALHLLGVVADATGDPARAAELIGQALRIRETATFRCDLGMALCHLGRHEEALSCCQRALALRPDYPEALNNLGVSLEALHRHVEAEQAYRRALAARPGYAEVLGSLGNALRSQGRLDEAAAAYEAAVAHNPAAPHAPLGHPLRALGRAEAAEVAFRQDVATHPSSPDALNNLTTALGEAGQPEEAAALLPRAVALRPDNPEAHANLAQVLTQLGRPKEAVTACKRALALRPDYPEALNSLGNALRDLHRMSESEAALRRAVALRPTDTGFFNNLALTLMAQDRPYEALAVLDLAAALDPDDAETHHHRATLLLRQGRLREGWDDYEWRIRTKQAGNSHTQFASQTPWRGERIDGRSILLAPEQGFGDMIQFSRYVPLLAARGARVLLALQPPLLRLMRTLPGPAELVAIGAPIPRHDLHCPLLSLPRAFATTLDTVPAWPSYMHAEPAAAARWAVRLRTLSQGCAWAWCGRATRGFSATASVPCPLPRFSRCGACRTCAGSACRSVRARLSWPLHRVGARRWAASKTSRPR